MGLPVGRAEEVLGSLEADVALHATGSALRQVMPQLELLIQSGMNVVSTCEELAFPRHAQPDLASRLDIQARTRGVSVLGTGVNPGFAMDTLPLVLSAASQVVEHVRVVRVLDAATRRLPLRRKVGIGISLREFEERRRRAAIGHVGLEQSVAMLAAGLGWELDGIEHRMEPVVAAATGLYGGIEVPRQALLGIRSVARGMVRTRECILLDLSMYAGAPEPHDAIMISGVPDLRLRIGGGLPGDECTAAVVLNAAAVVSGTRPGLLSMLDMPLPHGSGRIL